MRQRANGSERTSMSNQDNRWPQNEREQRNRPSPYSRDEYHRGNQDMLDQRTSTHYSNDHVGRQRVYNHPPRSSRSRSPIKGSKSQKSYTAASTYEENRNSMETSMHYSSQSHSTLSPSSTLILRGLAPTVTDGMLYEALAYFRPLGIRIILNKITGESRGFAFVDFQSANIGQEVRNYFASNPLILEQQAVQIDYTDEKKSTISSKPYGAMDWICDQCQITNFAKRIKCFKCDAPKPAFPQERPQYLEYNANRFNKAGHYRNQSDEALFDDGQGEPESKVLMARHLPLDVDEGELRIAFAEFLGIQDIRVIRDRMTNISRGFAFITFDSIESATKAINEAHRLTVRGGISFTLNYARELPPHAKSKQIGHPMNAIAAVALERAQWSLGRMQTQVAESGQGNQSSNTMPSHDDVTAFLNEAAASTQTSVLKPKNQWPQPFEVAGGTYVLKNDVGLYYDTASMFYYDTQSKLYYSTYTGEYYKCQNVTSTPVFEKWTVPLPKDNTEVDESIPLSQVTAGDASHNEKREQKKTTPNFTFGLKPAKASKAKQLKPGIFVSIDTANDIAKWTARQREGVSSTPEFAKPTISPEEQHHTPDSQGKKLSKVDEILQTIDEKSIDISTGPPVCLLCRRKFSSHDLLKKHEKLSKLHLENVRKSKEQREILAAEDRELEERIRKREEMEIKKNEGKNTAGANKRQLSDSEGSTNAPADATLATGLGGKMLKSMGWNTGEGLGKDGKGIKEPIAVTQGQSGNSSSNPGIGVERSELNSTPWMDSSEQSSKKEWHQKQLRARYETTNK